MSLQTHFTPHTYIHQKPRQSTLPESYQRLVNKIVELIKNPDTDYWVWVKNNSKLLQRTMILFRHPFKKNVLVETPYGETLRDMMIGYMYTYLVYPSTVDDLDTLIYLLVVDYYKMVQKVEQIITRTLYEVKYMIPVTEVVRTVKIKILDEANEGNTLSNNRLVLRILQKDYTLYIIHKALNSKTMMFDKKLLRKMILKPL